MPLLEPAATFCAPSRMGASFQTPDRPHSVERAAVSTLQALAPPIVGVLRSARFQNAFARQRNPLPNGQHAGDEHQQTRILDFDKPTT